MTLVSDCILWPGFKNKDGYGRTRRVVDGRIKSVLVHRAEYAKALGVSLSTLDGMVVRHKCDTPACMNPDHLELGTQTDNVKDMDDRGRRVSPGAPRRISSETKARVRKLRAEGWTYADIARETGMSDVYAAMIVRGEVR